MQNKNIYFAIAFAVFTFLTFMGFSLTYGRWEYLSYKHADEFSESIKRDAENGCMLEIPIKIKVMQYSDTNATVFMKGESKSTFLLKFSKNDVWTVREKMPNETYVCHYEVLNSTVGGSADQIIYWYF